MIVTASPSESASGLLKLTANANAALAGLKLLVGQQVDIKVLQVSTAGVKLEVAGNVLNAQSNLNLTQGQLLQARVGESNGQLRLIVSVADDKVGSSDKLFIKQLLPYTTPVANAIAQLMSPQLMASLPAAAQAQINVILSQILRLDTRLKSDELKQAIEASGAFFESGVKNKKQDLAKDLKAEFFKLKALLAENVGSTKSAPSLVQSLGLVGQAINQISLNQLLQQQMAELVMVQLPFLHGGEVDQLDVSLSKADDAKNEWQLKFSIALKQDNLSCVLNYNQDVDVFDCKIFMETEEGVAMINQHLAILEEMFEHAGLKLTHLSVLQGQLKFSSQKIKSGLVDVIA